MKSLNVRVFVFMIVLFFDKTIMIGVVAGVESPFSIDIEIVPSKLFVIEKSFVSIMAKPVLNPVNMTMMMAERNISEAIDNKIILFSILP